MRISSFNCPLDAPHDPHTWSKGEFEESVDGYRLIMFACTGGVEPVGDDELTDTERAELAARYRATVARPLSADERTAIEQHRKKKKTAPKDSTPTRVATHGPCELRTRHTSHIFSQGFRDTAGNLLLWDCPGQHAECANCDDVRCMSCATRQWHDQCEHDCPECCAPFDNPTVSQVSNAPSSAAAGESLGDRLRDLIRRPMFGWHPAGCDCHDGLAHGRDEDDPLHALAVEADTLTDTLERSVEQARQERQSRAVFASKVRTALDHLDGTPNTAVSILARLCAAELDELGGVLDE